MNGHVHVVEEHQPLAGRAELIERLIPLLREKAAQVDAPEADLNVVVSGDLGSSVRARKDADYTVEWLGGQVRGVTLPMLRDYSTAVIVIEAVEQVIVEGADFDFGIFNTINVLAHEYAHLIIGRMRAVTGTRPAPPTWPVSPQRLGLVLAYEAADEWRCDLFANSVLNHLTITIGDAEPRPVGVDFIFGDGYTTQLGNVLDQRVHPGWPDLVDDYRHRRVDLTDMHEQLVAETRDVLILLAHADATAIAAGAEAMTEQFARHPGMSLYLAKAWQPIRGILDETPHLPPLHHFAGIEQRIQACGSGLVDLWEQLGVTGEIRGQGLHLSVTDPVR